MKKQTAGTEYLRDESYFEGCAEEVFFVETKADIEEILKEVNPLTVQGSKTGISGACVPFNGNILNLSRFKGDPVIGQDEDGAYIDILPGTTFEEVESFLRRREAGKYVLPIEPTEKTASIGGAAATNAQGPTPLYASNLAEHLLEADVCFPAFDNITIKKGKFIFSENGELHLDETKKLQLEMLSDEEYSKIPIKLLTAKAGEDLLNVLVGSEGMLGIFERLRFRLVKRLKNNWNFLCFPPNEEKSFELLKAVLDENNGFKKNGLCALDYIDAQSVNCVKKHISSLDKYAQLPELPSENTPAVLIYFSKEEEIYDVLESLQSLFESSGIEEKNIWAADSKDESEIIKMFRHAVPESINRAMEENRKRCKKIRKLAIDMQVRESDGNGFEFDAFTELLKKNCEDIDYVYTIHAGRNVCHIDLLPQTETDFEKALNIKEKLIAEFVKTNSAFGVENGCGKGKYEGLENYIPKKQRKMMQEIKTFFDPHGVLNNKNFPFD